MEHTLLHNNNFEGLEKSLINEIKNLKREIHPLHNRMYNRTIRKRIEFVNWILETIKSDEKWTYPELVEIIDNRTDKLKKEHACAKVRTKRDRIYDQIQSMEWLKYLVTSTNRNKLGNLNIF